jgi:hypothetical protein
LKERPKLPDIGYVFKGNNFGEELRALLRAKNRSDQIARFRQNFFAGHGVFGSAANIVDPAR